MFVVLQGITWGCAYKITGHTALEYLEKRECTLGGYITEYAKFYPRVAFDNSEISGEAFPVLLYIATPENCHWMGDDCPKKMAHQIAESSGPSGHNVEYLLRLAEFVRDEVPGADDEHLFTLEKNVKEILQHRQVPLMDVMGNAPQRIRRDSHEEIRRPVSFEYSSRVPDKKLRCLNI